MQRKLSLDYLTRLLNIKEQIKKEIKAEFRETEKSILKLKLKRINSVIYYHIHKKDNDIVKAEYFKKYRKNNLDKFKEYSRVYRKKRRKR